MEAFEVLKQRVLHPSKHFYPKKNIFLKASQYGYIFFISFIRLVTLQYVTSFSILCSPRTYCTAAVTINLYILLRHT